MASASSPTPATEFWDLSSANHDAVALLREPARDRLRTSALAAAALATTFALGWAGALIWHDVAGPPAPSQIARKETPAPRTTNVRPSSVARRTVASDPVVTGSIPKSATAAPRLPALATTTTINAPSVALAMQQPLLPAPETRPSTIPGWSVVEVRDGTAVLDGPDGVRMAARGDVIPGIGRVDSIVRWGDLWIVATANGLIATR
ncbi:hypothetical protein JQ596_26260 [Bradyrhizobium manausense]|uniref:hypothetical protein n=1 Tax=Bradyrhizobium TaxID=374 RepID=UPI001BAD36A4|nr:MULTISPECIES: hypothetical protein [Bradyrhizobium]MBR0829045.1 hypothetical protein [Bradyrhizobium manausense]UVO27951.1 hypothetical protein KUF59_36680 [Bradyrhizobium arachidis]